MKRAKTIVLLLMGLFITIGAGCGLAETRAGAKTKSEIHNRKDFDAYLAKFNSRDYQGFLDYFADKFEMIHVGGNLKSRGRGDEVLWISAQLHQGIGHC